MADKQAPKKPSPLEVKNAVLGFFAEHKYAVLVSQSALSNPRYFGEAEFSTNTITLNPRRGNLFKVLETLVHEAVHLMQPEWKHGTVNRYEREVMALLSSQERQWIFYRAMLVAVWRD